MIWKVWMINDDFVFDVDVPAKSAAEARQKAEMINRKCDFKHTKICHVELWKHGKEQKSA